MAIGPIEIQGTIGRAQDFSLVKQNEDNKGILDQSNLLNQTMKEAQHKPKFVSGVENTENKEFRYDAKDGSGASYEGNQKNKKKKQPPTDKVIPKGYGSGFDMKI
ncbi:MAG: hypothetical protein HGA25_00205 [Clostridiales bacterium]|nr:hypothetical protein [Clostridiales bacterium]